MEALEGQVSRLESVRRDMEHKLTSMYSSLRRVAGIRLDGGSGGQSWRPPSPAGRRPGVSLRGQSRIPRALVPCYGCDQREIPTCYDLILLR